MVAKKLDEEGFQFYFNLGPNRSYALVAEYFGVSKRSVTRAAAAEGWQARIEDMNKKSVKSALEAMSVDVNDAALKNVSRAIEMEQAWNEVLTVDRMKKLVATLFKVAVQKGDVSAAKALIDRVYGKPKHEVAQVMDLDLPAGMQNTKDVRVAAIALLRGMADGVIAPVDAQRAAAVVETARKSIELEDMDVRMREIEETLKQIEKDDKRRGW